MVGDHEFINRWKGSNFDSDFRRKECDEKF